MKVRVADKKHSRVFDVNRVPGQPRKRRKITLTFDEEKRREFLSGFRKRKLERKEKAKEALNTRLKEEKKRIKQDVKGRYKKLVSNRDIPELQEILCSEEYEVEGRTVSILELNVGDLAKSRNMIGQNQTEEDETEDEEDKEKEKQRLIEKKDKIPGMDTSDEEDDNDNSHDVPVDPVSETNIKRAIKKATTEQLLKSKAYLMKQKFERIKNKKLAERRKKNAKIAAKKQNSRPKKRTADIRRK